MIRNAIGSLLGLAGAAAAVWSPFRAWYDGRPGRHYRVGELFSGVTTDPPALLGSLLLPMLCAALLALCAVLRRSRPLMGLAGLVVLGAAVLWMVRQGQAAGGLAVGVDGEGLGEGLACAVGAGALLLLAAVVMRGRRRRPRGRGLDLEPVAPRPAAEPEPWGPGGRY
ncbi:hypothetical protein AB0469_14240 [Streptomyces sp. NPDC093801]|uniref:hypothetical protein n=1 Tax=Streptomyces sp. NPDC093801 TaxID=3155203 RepID=UPI00344D0CEE